MLFVIVATGNHFFFDALAGGLVVAAGWLVAGALVHAPLPATPAPGTGEHASAAA